MAGSKRGVHLALSLERLEALAGRRLTRIGLSATQKPIEDVARFLVGTRNLRRRRRAPTAPSSTPATCARRDLALEIPAAPLEAVMSGEVWTQVYDRLAELVGEHRTTLVFVNTRRQAERVARHLSERLGEEHVTAHHGSMAKELRLDAEQRLKRGELQRWSPPPRWSSASTSAMSISSARSARRARSPPSCSASAAPATSVGGTPKGRLFPLSRDDLVECAALLRRGAPRRARPAARSRTSRSTCWRSRSSRKSAAREWDEDELFALLPRRLPVPRADARGVRGGRAHAGGGLQHPPRPPRRAHPPRRRQPAACAAARGARLTALTSGGTIPDTADYQVMLEPQAQFVGTVNEDFAVESLQGDIFQLGNVSYRILRVEQGTVRVEDAHGAAALHPVLAGRGARAHRRAVGERVAAAQRSSRQHLDGGAERRVRLAGRARPGSMRPAAVQLVAYLAAARAALGALPTQQPIVFERFFDEAGGMQLVIHSPFGSRINRAWGLALRKRFCRSFNFELQAAATEDTHRAVAHAPRTASSSRTWRATCIPTPCGRCWCRRCARRRCSRRAGAGTPTIALALPRFRGGKKVPAPLARMAAEDLLAVGLPRPGGLRREPARRARDPRPSAGAPDDPRLPRGRHGHRGLRAAAARPRGRQPSACVARDLTEPSPLALEVLSARPYAFLDDAPLEERRTQAVMSRRWLDPQSAADIGKLDAGGHRARARRGLAGRHRRRRAARCAAVAHAS